jgi:hypothetical protein
MSFISVGRVLCLWEDYVYGKNYVHGTCMGIYWKACIYGKCMFMERIVFMGSVCVYGKCKCMGRIMFIGRVCVVMGRRILMGSVCLWEELY